MDIEEVRQYALSLQGVTEDMPYGDDWLMFRIERKSFALMWLEAPEPRCSVKLKPEVGAALRERYDGIRPAYHLNKVHWNDLFLDQLEDNLIRKLIKASYLLVLGALPKRLREKYEI